ncbi:MAG: CoA-binding protein [Candidatus Lokiarchaeota archaeon]|nr:CoA-binding protein [Candidatus Lokiarchaeota archaeon]
MKDLQPFFNPKSVLIIGVSRQALSFSFTVLKNLLEIFYKGKLYILNPNANDILGVKSYHSFEELPEIPELAVIVLGKDILKVVENLGKIGVKYVAIQTELKPGTQINDLTFKLHQMCIKYNITYLGPSMLGIINFSDNFTSSIIPVRQHIMRGNKNIKEGMSFIAQSGGLAGAMGWWTPSQRLPISKVIHLGNGFHINEADVLEYFLHDNTTKVISLFLREISDELIEAVKKVSPTKPILFYYVGKEEEQEVKLRDAGGILVLNYIELFEVAKIFLWCPEPKSVNLGIIGPSSGAIHLIIKEMRNQDLALAKPSEYSRNIIFDKVGGSTCNFGNPVDYWPPEKFVGIKICGIYNAASEALLSDKAVDGLILALEFFTEIEFDFNIYASLLERYPNKPIIAILIQAEREGAKRVIKSATELKIPVFENEIERAVRGYKLLYDYYSKIKKRN